MQLIEFIKASLISKTYRTLEKKRAPMFQSTRLAMYRPIQMPSVLLVQNGENKNNKTFVDIEIHTKNKKSAPMFETMHLAMHGPVRPFSLLPVQDAVNAIYKRVVDVE